MRLLVGDIGGTNSRFGLVNDGGVRPSAIEVEKGGDHPNFEDALAAYLERAPAKPDHAAFAIAGPTHGRRAKLTNRDWTVDADALERRFGIGRVELMNDFVAQAACLPHLDAGEMETIGDTSPDDDAAKAAVGPGTGLGVAGLLRYGDRWVPVPSEGGHVEFAAATDREAALFAVIRRRQGRVSAEMALSGGGLAELYMAARAVDGLSGDPVGAADVTVRAEDGEALAREIVAIFIGALARFMGDVALTFGARGGVYLCGGVVPKLMKVADLSSFRADFEAKAPHEALMRETATVLVTSPIAGLIGCAATANSLSTPR